MRMKVYLFINIYINHANFQKEEMLRNVYDFLNNIKLLIMKDS